MQHKHMDKSYWYIRGSGEDLRILALNVLNFNNLFLFVNPSKYSHLLEMHNFYRWSQTSQNWMSGV